MTVDRFRQIYCSSVDGILVFHPTQNTMIGKIPVKETVSNCTFNHNQTSLYITASTSVYAIDLDAEAISKL
jgi:gluconolactonase